MDSKKFGRLVNHPRHIPGIHNYCDRWCQRCPFTLRCSVFAVEAHFVKDSPEHKREDESLWTRLETASRFAAELIATHADHPGVGLPKDPLLKKKGKRPADTHRIGVASKRYMEFAHALVKKHGDAFANSSANLGIHAVSLAEAFDVIAWFHMMIMIKLSRALPREGEEDDFEDDPELADMPRDEDGSAKIALIGIDRSILSWAVLSLHEPKLLDGALSGMLTLHRLRISVEKMFPKARGFVRPGFDTHIFPGDKK